MKFNQLLIEKKFSSLSNTCMYINVLYFSDASNQRTRCLGLGVEPIKQSRSAETPVKNSQSREIPGMSVVLTLIEDEHIVHNRS